MTERPASVFFDTSVLLAALIDFGDASADPGALFDALVAGRIPAPRTAWHCCLEFYSVATRLPEEFRLTPADAHRLLSEEIFGRLEIHQLPARQRQPFFDAAARDALAGGRIHDAEIAAVALASGATTLVTDNRRHFQRFATAGLQVLSSRELRGRLPR